MKKSFTLIELLVVIAIIGLLATVVMVSVGGATKKARDAKRKSDLAELRKALEMYYLDNGEYPQIGSWIFSTDNAWEDTLGSALSNYITKMPKDPINDNGEDGGGPWKTDDDNYVYAYMCKSIRTDYDLVARLENENDDARCEKKCWEYHYLTSDKCWCGGISSFCSGNRTWSNYLYADH